MPNFKKNYVKFDGSRLSQSLVLSGVVDVFQAEQVSAVDPWFQRQDVYVVGQGCS